MQRPKGQSRSSSGWPAPCYLGYLPQALCTPDPLCEPDAPSLGNSEPALPQAVLWAKAGEGPSHSCPWFDPLELPSGAERTVQGQTGVGERVVDGADEYSVSCVVTPLSDDRSAYGVYLELGLGVDLLQFSGTVGETPGNVLNVNVTAFGLEQADCTVEVDTLVPGAVWFRSVSCPRLVNSTGALCSESFGVIFENCDHSSIPEPL
jgi:hypothetical protein